MNCFNPRRIRLSTVLHYGQFAAQRNNYWYLNFLQSLMIFAGFLHKNHKFYEILTIFLMKTAKIWIFFGLKLRKIIKNFQLFTLPLSAINWPYGSTVLSVSFSQYRGHRVKTFWTQCSKYTRKSIVEVLLVRCRFENLEYLFICGLSGFPGVIFQESSYSLFVPFTKTASLQMLLRAQKYYQERCTKTSLWGELAI